MQKTVKWTQLALKCYQSSANCQSCIIDKIITDKPCKMPKTIVELLEIVGPPTSLNTVPERKVMDVKYYEEKKTKNKKDSDKKIKNNKELIARMVENGQSFQKISKEIDVSATTLQRHIRKLDILTPEQEKKSRQRRKND